MSATAARSPRLRLHRDTVRHLTVRPGEPAAGFRTEEICVYTQPRTECVPITG
jgi:hypothetical protein